MNENESNYEIIVTKNEYDRLNSDMSALKQTNNLLKQQNHQLSTKVYELSQNLEKSIRDYDQIQKLQMKISTLSRTVLRLSGILIKFNEAGQKTNNKKQTSGKETFVDELIKRLEDLQTQKAEWQRTTNKMEKQYLLLLEVKQKTISDLEDNMRKFKDAIYIAQKREQNQIIKEWKIKPQYVAAVRQITINQNQRQRNFMKQKIQQLQNQKKQLNILVFNERAIVDIFRKKLEEKQNYIKSLLDRNPQKTVKQKE